MALDTNLVSYWKMDESSGNAADSVGSNTGTNTNVTYAAGKINNGAVFNGSAVYSITDTASLKPSGSFSVSFWAKTSTAGGTGLTIIQSYSQPSRVSGFQIQENATDSKLRFLVGKNTGVSQGTDWNQVFSPAAINDGNWHFYVCVMNTGTNILIYVDGVGGTPVSYTGGIAYDTTNYIRLGCANISGTNNGFWTGNLDEVGIWSRALSADEVSQLYNSNRALAYPLTAPTLYGGVEYFKLDEASGNITGAIKGLVGTNNGTTTFAAAKINNGANFVSTSSHFFALTDADWDWVDYNVPFTFSYWIKATITSSTYGYQIGKESGGGVNGFSCYLYSRAANTCSLNVSLMNLNTTNTKRLVVKSPDLIAYSGAWTHVAVTYSGNGSYTGMQIYINGSAVTTVALDSTYETCNATITNNSKAAIGSQQGDSYANGVTQMLDEVGIFNRVLTSTEISTLYNAGAGLQYPWAVSSANTTNFFNFM